MKKNLYALFILFSIAAQGQNLVPNYSFEILSTCPTGQSQINLATSWDVAPNTGGASPDLFNACDPGGFNVPSNVVGFQNAQTGVGYAGFYTFGYDCREYIEAQLISPLTAGVTYNVEVYVSPAEEAGIAVDGIGIYISTGVVSGNGTYNPLTVIPQITNPVNSVISDSAGWTLVSGTYIASGGEDHITIGNFLDDVSTDTTIINLTGWGRGYYFVDDVSVTALTNPPVAAFSASNHICPGTCIDFTNMSQNGNSYLWTFPGANPGQSTDLNPTSICYNSPGQYAVTLIATNQNGSDTLTLPNYITVYPQPSPQGIIQSGDTLFANAGASSYQWYFNGNIINGATDYFYLATASGDYNVVATDENDCEVEAVINNVIASTSSTVDCGPWTVFPNPVQDRFTMQNSRCTMGTAKAKLTIYNLMGEKIMDVSPHSLGKGLGGEAIWTVDFRSVSSGMYYIEIHANNNIYRSKFLKQ